MYELHESFQQYNSIIHEEIDILKHTVEKCSSNNGHYSPMLTFMSSVDKRMLTVTIPHQDNHENTFVRIAETLHLYSSLRAYSVVVSMIVKKQINNQEYNALAVFALTSDFAGIISIPYTLDSSNVVTWHDDLFEMENVDDQDFDPTTKDMITMFFFFTHIENPAYTASEVLSYLSRIGCALYMFDNFDVPYFDLTPVS